MQVDTFTDISAEQMLDNINKNILNICKTYEYTTNEIIKENVKHVLDIVINCSDKFEIYDKLKQRNLHSIAFRVIESKIIRIFSISGTESIEYVDKFVQPTDIRDRNEIAAIVKPTDTKVTEDIPIKPIRVHLFWMLTYKLGFSIN